MGNLFIFFSQQIVHKIQDTGHSTKHTGAQQKKERDRRKKSGCPKPISDSGPIPYQEDRRVGTKRMHQDHHAEKWVDKCLRSSKKNSEKIMQMKQWMAKKSPK